MQHVKHDARELQGETMGKGTLTHEDYQCIDPASNTSVRWTEKFDDNVSQ